MCSIAKLKTQCEFEVRSPHSMMKENRNIFFLDFLRNKLLELFQRIMKFPIRIGTFTDYSGPPPGLTIK